MKPVYVVLIAIATAIVGGGIGLVGGVALGGFGGMAGGTLLGICITTETAREEGLLTAEQATQLVDLIRQNAETEFQLPPGELQDLNCEEVSRDLQSR
ncbi:MAG: hypothetical protein ACP5D7_09505 [Limnospira sp.]